MTRAPWNSGISPEDDLGDERFRLLVDSVQDYAIFMLDATGHVRSWNAGAQRLKGYQASEILGQHIEVFYPDEAIARRWPQEELRRAEIDGRIEDEGWRLRKDGQRFWASVVITALRDPSGALQGFAKVTRDLTERREHEETLRQSEEQLRLLVGAVDDYAIFMLSPAGHILSWNAGAERIKGYAASEVAGRHFSMFFDAEDIAAGLPGRELAVAQRDGRAETEGWRRRKSGERFWANVVLTRVLGPDGTLRGFAKVTRDLSETRRWAELEQSSRRMEEFLAMLAHELRNPLAPLRNAVEVMTLRDDLPPYMTRIRGMMDRQTRHLTRLVDDLLDVARITTGKISLVIDHMDLCEVIRASVEAARPQFDARRQVLRLDLPVNGIGVQGDAIRLAQAIQNLLHNANRYTPEGGEVQVSGRHQDAEFVLDVADNGIGLQPEALERIFTLFRQEGSPRNTADSGLGIGLSLARRIAELHGGRLAAHSDGPDRGCTFTLTVPAPDIPAPAESGGPARPAAGAQRVLVIDDNIDSTDSMVALLDELGYPALGAYSGAEGLAAAEQFRPDIVLLDLNMPTMDGYQVAKRLRAACGDVLGIIAMTGYGRHSDRHSTELAGFDKHLTKPVAFERLEAALTELAHRL